MVNITIKKCFDLFINHINKEVNNFKFEGDIENMDISEIKSITRISYMNYVLSQTYTSVKQNNVTIAYEHLMKIIEEEINKSEEFEEVKIKENIQPILKKKSQKKGWFY